MKLAAVGHVRTVPDRLALTLERAMRCVKSKAANRNPQQVQDATCELLCWKKVPIQSLRNVCNAHGSADAARKKQPELVAVLAAAFFAHLS
eukprot:5426130-Prymnesium_polylepis.2